MFCSKCGTYIERGELCAQCTAEENGFINGFPGNVPASHTPAEPKENKSALPLIFKIGAVVLAILAFVLHLADLITTTRDEVTENEYISYIAKEELEEDREDIDEDDISAKREQLLETESFDFYDNEEESEGALDEDMLRHAQRFLEWAFLAFALYIGAFFASFYIKNEKICLFFQGVFFSIMVGAFIFILLSTCTGESFAKSTLDYNPYTGEDVYLYYSKGYSVTFTYILALASAIGGLALTVVSGLGLNKLCKKDK